MLNILEVLQYGDEVEIQIVGISENFRAKIVGFDNCPGRHPLLKIVDNETWKCMVLRDGDYVIKKVLSLEKCAICGGETIYTKDTPVQQRKNYSKEFGQVCDECAKKKD